MVNHKGDMGFARALWLGKSYDTDEHICALETGELITTRTVKRLPEERRFNRTAVAAVTHMPWHRRGRGTAPRGADPMVTPPADAGEDLAAQEAAEGQPAPVGGQPSGGPEDGAAPVPRPEGPDPPSAPEVPAPPAPAAPAASSGSAGGDAPTTGSAGTLGPKIPASFAASSPPHNTAAALDKEGPPEGQTLAHSFLPRGEGGGPRLAAHRSRDPGFLIQGFLIQDPHRSQFWLSWHRA